MSCSLRAPLAVVFASLLVVAVDLTACNNPLFATDRTPSYVPIHLTSKFADLALLTEPVERSNKLCFSGAVHQSCCSDRSYAVLQSVAAARLSLQHD
jgi:hypothetical protein